MSQDTNAPEQLNPNQDATELLAKARAAHTEKKFSEARTLYDQAIGAAGPDQAKAEIADQARAFRALLAQEASAGEPGDFSGLMSVGVGLVTILTTLGWLLVLQPDFSELRGNAKAESARLAASEASQPQPASSEANRSSGEVADLTLNFTPVSFAFLGAYFFGIQMLFRRFVRRDLGSNAYFAFANRIILAIIAVWVTVVAYSVIVGEPHADSETQQPQAAAAQATPPAGPAAPASAKLSRLATGASAPPALLIFGFLVGVFPRLLWQFISAAVTKIPGVKPVMPSIEANFDVVRSWRRV